MSKLAWSLVGMLLAACSSTPKIGADTSASKSVFALDHQQKLFERREWFDKSQPECGKEKSRELLVRWAEELQAICKESTSKECVLREQSLISPPRELPSSVHLCELWVKVDSSEGSMNFSFDGVTGVDQLPDVQKRQVECLNAREAEIGKVAPSYHGFMERIRKEEASQLQGRITLSLCADPRIMDAQVYKRMQELSAPVAKGDEIQGVSAETFKVMSRAMYVHEMSHLLSSTLNESKDPSVFILWEVTPKSQQSLRLPRMAGLPKSHEIYKRLLKYSVPLSTVEKYFSQENSNDFYVLLDEWNAYLNQLEYVGADPQECSIVEDSFNSVVEFLIYIRTYVDYVQEKNPKLYAQMIANKGVQSSMRHLLQRSRDLLNGTQKLKCYKYTDAEKASRSKAAFDELLRIWGA